MVNSVSFGMAGQHDRAGRWQLSWTMSSCSMLYTVVLYTTSDGLHPRVEAIASRLEAIILNRSEAIATSSDGLPPTSDGLPHGMLILCIVLYVFCVCCKVAHFLRLLELLRCPDNSTRSDAEKRPDSECILSDCPLINDVERFWKGQS